MKHIFNKPLIGILFAVLFLTGCSDILQEQPRSMFTPAYFSTDAGVQGGLTSLYATLRLWGSGYFMNAYQDGTDESTWGGNSDNNIWQLDFSGVSTISPQSSNTNFLWGAAFPAINTASGVIENGTAAGISNSLLAEAYFFRGFYYFWLVQTYGGVPLDLGAGDLKFNTSTIRVSVRNTVPEVYTKGIFPDLLQAINDLGDSRIQGGVSKTLAQLYLAKAYLTYGWWLENPNNIPTYPACDGADPDGHDPQWYYQQAYNVATAAIAAPSQGFFGDAQTQGSFGLQPTFYDVNNGANERNSEELLYSDHTANSTLYNGSDPNGYSGGSLAGPENFVCWFEQFNYTSSTNSSSNTTWTKIGNLQAQSASGGPLMRSAMQSLGRPWTMNAPPQGIFYNTFADKTNDSRYDGTFVTCYRAILNEGGVTNPVYGPNFIQINQGDPVITFLPNDTTGVDYSNKPYDSSIGAGVLPGRGDFVIEPNQISRTRFPGNWKVGPYRTDTNGFLTGMNASSTRPFYIAKFSELYLIAAEAAVKGASGSMSARDLVNVLRARAGIWHFNNNKHIAVNEDHSADMIAATPAAITIDYILSERSREFFGEEYRWLDLVRTQKWIDYSRTFTIVDYPEKNNWGNKPATTVTRNITPQNYLRPIPQTQIDGLDMSDGDKAAYQNPGY